MTLHGKSEQIKGYKRESEKILRYGKKKEQISAFPCAPGAGSDPVKWGPRLSPLYLHPLSIPMAIGTEQSPKWGRAAKNNLLNSLHSHRSPIAVDIKVAALPLQPTWDFWVRINRWKGITFSEGSLNCATKTHYLCSKGKSKNQPTNMIPSSSHFQRFCKVFITTSSFHLKSDDQELKTEICSIWIKLSAHILFLW